VAARSRLSDTFPTPEVTVRLATTLASFQTAWPARPEPSGVAALTRAFPALGAATDAAFRATLLDPVPGLDLPDARDVFLAAPDLSALPFAVPDLSALPEALRRGGGALAALAGL
jgi:hypothetical protein